MGNAALIYAAIRFKFKRCLLFVISAVILTVSYDIAYIIILAHSHILGFSFYNSYFILDYCSLAILNFALIPASIALARFFSACFKKEWAIVLLSLVAILLLNILTDAAEAVLSFSSMQALAQDIYKNIKILSLLRDELITAIGYGLIYLIFADDKKEILHNSNLAVKKFASRLWASTAK